MKKIKIFFILPTLLTGGAENVCTIVINHLDKQKYQPYVLCLKRKGENLKKLRADVPVIDINSPSVHYSILKIYRLIKANKPDIVVGWMGYINAYLGFYIPFLPKNIKWVCRESSIPRLMNKELRLTALFNFYYKFYNRYQQIICQSEYMASDLIRTFKVKEEKITIISNPVDFSLVEKNLQKEPVNFVKNKYNLLYVGGLRKVKRIGLLIRTLALLPQQYSLTIMGRGEEYDNIQTLINELQLTNRIKVITDCYNPYPYYFNSDVLLLSSLFEGFPNVILEGFACGCPAIGFNIQGGANEILENYGGFIVKQNDLNDFASQIITVCEKTNIDRKKIIENCKQKYNAEKIISEYETVFSI